MPVSFMCARAFIFTAALVTSCGAEPRITRLESTTVKSEIVNTIIADGFSSCAVRVVHLNNDGWRYLSYIESPFVLETVWIGAYSV